MSISSALLNGLQGIQAGFNRADRASGQIASFGVDDNGRLAQNMVDLKQSEFQVKASADVVKSADSILGTLLDIKA